MELISQPAILTAVISAATSVLTIIFIKPFLDKSFLKFKLEQEHLYEQRKKIKNVIAEHKIHILNSAEALSHRLRAVLKIKDDDSKRIYWQKLNKGEYYDEDYLVSTVYRFLIFFSRISELEEKLIFLDTTIASKNDLFFVKYLQLFPQVFCGSHLFNGTPFQISKINIEKDRFRRNEFRGCLELLKKDEEFITYNEFKTNYHDIYLPKIQFINDFFQEIDPLKKERLNWDVLQIFWFVLSSFLNSYGYDFQEVKNDWIVRSIEKGKEQRLLSGFEKLIADNKLSNQRSIKLELILIKKHHELLYKNK
jgi:hypothetical protein